MKLGFELFRWRKQCQLNFLSAEPLRRERVKGELNAASFDQLLAKFSPGRVVAAQLFRVKAALPSRFVVDNPNVFVSDSRLPGFLPTENKIDPAPNPQRLILANWNHSWLT